MAAEGPAVVRPGGAEVVASRCCTSCGWWVVEGVEVVGRVVDGAGGADVVGGSCGEVAGGGQDPLGLEDCQGHRPRRSPPRLLAACTKRTPQESDGRSVDHFHRHLPCVPCSRVSPAGSLPRAFPLEPRNRLRYGCPYGRTGETWGRALPAEAVQLRAGPRNGATVSLGAAPPR